MIRHRKYAYSSHISNNYFIEPFVIIDYFPHMAIWPKFTSTIIDDKRSYLRSIANSISCSGSICASIYSISSPSSLLATTIYIRKKFWGDTCCTIRTISSSEAGIDVCRDFPHRDEISLTQNILRISNSLC